MWPEVLGSTKIIDKGFQLSKANRAVLCLEMWKWDLGLGPNVWGKQWSFPSQAAHQPFRTLLRLGRWGIEPALQMESVSLIKRILVVTPREPEANTRLPATVLGGEQRRPGCGEGAAVRVCGHAAKLRRPLRGAGLGSEAIVPSAHSQRERRENDRKLCPCPPSPSHI